MPSPCASLFAHAFLALLLAPLLQACSPTPPTGTDPTPVPSALPPVKAGGDVTVDARIVPAHGVSLSFAESGRVQQVLVAAGDTVKSGQVLVRLASEQQAAQVLQAEAELAAAQAALDKAKKGAEPSALTAAEAAVVAADSAIRSAEAGRTSAQAQAKRAETGGTSDEIEVAKHRVEEAKNGLWGYQARRDTICGRVNKGADQADCDIARADVQRGEELVKIAELELARLQRGGRPEDVAVARAKVGEAEAAVQAARAQSASASAERDQVKQGSTKEDLDAANARVDAARAGLEGMRLRMDAARLTSPMAGVVADVAVREGEQVDPGTIVVRLAEANAWQVETDDLSELAVVGLAEGEPVTVLVDALPGLEIPGTVERVGGFGEDRQGDVIFKAVVRLQKQDPRLRWNMTAAVRFRAK